MIRESIEGIFDIQFAFAVTFIFLAFYSNKTRGTYASSPENTNRRNKVWKKIDRKWISGAVSNNEITLPVMEGE